MPANEPNWYSVTTSAQRDWKEALQRYWRARSELGNPWLPDLCPEQAVVESALKRDRAEYRHRVLSWFWKLVAPIGVGQCVPNEIANLLAEDWDERTGVTAAAPGR